MTPVPLHDGSTPTHTAATGAGQLLPATARLGPVQLAVTDADRARMFWTRVLGLTELGDDARAIRLGTGGRELVSLVPGATAPVARGRTGLYHLAIHLPARNELARVIARLFAYRVPNSPTDHLVTETSYLSDPDGNGIELTFETPERGELLIIDGQPVARGRDGTLYSGRDPVNFDSLLGELADTNDLTAPLPAGSRIGHVHLHVDHLEAVHAFYRDLVGFRPLLHMPAIRMADFALASSAVPHALAINTWAGDGALPPPSGSAGLRYFTIELNTPAEVEAVAARLRAGGVPPEPIERGIRVLDPARNPLHIVATTSSSAG